jgi:hypothetical protein
MLGFWVIKIGRSLCLQKVAALSFCSAFDSGDTRILDGNSNEKEKFSDDFSWRKKIEIYHLDVWWLEYTSR